MIPNLIRSIYYILFFFAPLAVFTSTSELFELNKMFLIYLAATTVGFLWLILIACCNVKPKVTPIVFLPFLLFLFSQVLSTIFSIDIHTSIFGYYGRFNGGLTSLIAYAVLAYVCVQMFTMKHVLKLLTVSMVSSVVVVLWGLTGTFGRDMSCLVFSGDFSSVATKNKSFMEVILMNLHNNCWTDQFKPAERMFSLLGQPNWLGAYLTIHLPIGMYFLAATRRLHHLLYIVLIYTGVLLTRSDSAVLASFAVFGGAIPALLFLSHRHSEKKHNVIFPFAALIILVVILTLSIKTGIGFIDRHLTFVSSSPVTTPLSSSPGQPTQYHVDRVTDSFDIRKIVWRGAAELGNKYPLFGTGVETFAYSYYFVRPQEHNITSEWDYLYNKAHNEFFNYLATTGYVGLIAYLILITSVIVLGWRIVSHAKQPDNRLLAAALLTSYVSILITNAAGFSTSTVHLFFFLIPSFLVIFHSGQKDEIEVKNNTADLKRKFKIALLTFLYALIIVSLLNFYRADLMYAKADFEMKQSNYQEAVELLSEALKIHHEHVYEDKLSTALANLSYIAAYQEERDTAISLMDLSKYYNLKSLKASPQNVLYWKTMAKNYYLYYQISLDAKDLHEGIEALVAAEKLSPTDPKIPYSVSLYYSLLEDASETDEEKVKYRKLALTEVEESITLKPNFEEGYYLKGQLLKKQGKIEEAHEVFEFILKNVNPKSEDAARELVPDEPSGN